MATKKKKAAASTEPTTETAREAHTAKLAALLESVDLAGAAELVENRIDERGGEVTRRERRVLELCKLLDLDDDMTSPFWEAIDARRREKPHQRGSYNADGGMRTPEGVTLKDKLGPNPSDDDLDAAELAHVTDMVDELNDLLSKLA